MFAARFYVGQNIATSWTYPRPNALGATPEFAKQITNWFNEVRGYHFRSTSHATGHYSQLIWGDSHLVGCGYAYYHDKSRGYTKVYVCNYGPGGNIAGNAPYQTGAPACPLYGTKPSSKYHGLCCKYPHHRSSLPRPGLGAGQVKKGTPISLVFEPRASM